MTGCHTKIVLFFIAIISVAFQTSTTHADLVVTIGQPADIGNDADTPLGPFVAGESVSIPVLAFFESPITPPLTAYTLTVDFGGDGAGINPFFLAPEFLDGSGEEIIADDSFAGPLPIDFVLNWSGSLQLSTNAANPTTLFTINFNTQRSTPQGIYDIQFGTDAGSRALTAFVANGANFTVDNVVADDGQFLIMAVPEPAGATLLLAVSLFFARARNRSYS